MLGSVIAFQHKKCTLLELVEKYISTKTGVRPTTKAGYKTVLNFLSKDPFGRKRIDTVRLSDAKCWLIKLQADGKSYSSIHSLRGVLRPAFKMAVDDDLILKNPFGFQLRKLRISWSGYHLLKKYNLMIRPSGLIIIKHKESAV